MWYVGPFSHHNQILEWELNYFVLDILENLLFLSTTMSHHDPILKTCGYSYNLWRLLMENKRKFMKKIKKIVRSSTVSYSR